MTDERVQQIARRTSMLALMRAVANGLRGTQPARLVHTIVAIDRLLQRLLQATSWVTWVVKGGYANQLRNPGEARTTEDVDLAVDAAIETATEMLTSAFGVDLDDLFAFELAGPPGPSSALLAVASATRSSLGSVARSWSGSRWMSALGTRSSATSKST